MIGRMLNSMFPPFTPRRRYLQAGQILLRSGPTAAAGIFGGANTSLLRQFSSRSMTCNVCGKVGPIQYKPQDIQQRRDQKISMVRETLECRHCESWMRIRVLAAGLVEEVNLRSGSKVSNICGLSPLLDDMDILDTDATGIIARRLSSAPSYKTSHYQPDRAFGRQADGSYNVDLENICFPDDAFDVILTTDVLEHVRDFRRASGEMLRCLKPGGVHIFTIPCDLTSPFTKVLIDTSTEADVFVETPQIHGDNISSGVPAYRVFGRDVLDEMRLIGYEASLRRFSDQDSGIFDGFYFLARKPISD